jgi:predicted kinase
MIIVTFGLPGSGKTYFAQHLARQLAFPHISSDEVRTELNKLGQYNPEDRLFIYREMIKRADEVLKKNPVVILDATYTHTEYQRTVLEYAADHSQEIRWILMTASEDITYQRVSKKRDFTEADFSVYLTLKEQFNPPDFPLLTLDSGKLTLENMVSQVKKYIGYES